MACIERSLSQNPIFVVGYPRSGTTLLQALLATQDDLATFPETHFFSSVFTKDANVHDSIDCKTAEKILEDISQKSGITFEDHFIKCLKNSSESISIKQFFEALVSKLFPENADFSQRWLEKTPTHGLYMENIFKFYPEAKFVGIIRNPFHAIYSRTKNFPPKVRDQLSFLSKEWVDFVKAFEEFQGRHPDCACLVKYEDLTKDSEVVISQICKFLNIEFDRTRLDSYQHKAEGIIQPFEYWKNDVKTARIFTRKEDPKSIFSVGKILKIQSIVLEKMKKYGYERQYPVMQKIYNFFL